MIHSVRCFISVGCFIRSTCIAAVLLLAVLGCVGPASVTPQPGESETSVVSRLGRPTHVFEKPDGAGRILEYMQGPFGQTTYMAKIDRNGILVSYQQVLTQQNFARIQVGTSTKTDVLHLIGSPSDTSYLALPDLEVWSYPYKENPISDSVMHVHFDHAGIVRKLLNGPDFRRDPEWGNSFGLHRGRRER